MWCAPGGRGPSWKAAKPAPVYKEGAVTHPSNCRMLAVNNTLYRLYTSVLRSIVQTGCNALQQLFIFRHLTHAAQILQTQGSPRLHTTFIDFKQVYESIPRVRLWDHLQKCQMPSQLISIIKDLYQDEENILIKGDKRASVQPTRGVKQRCPLSPLLFSIYINGIGWITEGETGAVTGLPNFRVSNMLYADDLVLTANNHTYMQAMLNKLQGYATRKRLTVNTKT
eukprot:1136180-Pelagomonas_calceolata.AAC.1